MKHLTLQTGHSRHSPRNEVHRKTVDLIRPAVKAGAGALGSTGWSIKIMSGPVPGSAVFECHFGKWWMATCYMAWTDDGFRGIWPLASGFPGVSSGLKVPDVPWVAAGIMPDAILSGRFDLLFELGDLERCVAWTVLDTVSSKERAKGEAR